MASRSDKAKPRRWRAGVWPSTPPPRPRLAFPGPVGLWEGGAFIPFDLAENEGLLDDERLRLPPPGEWNGLHQVDQQRCQRWEQEERGGRGEVYLRLETVDLEDIDEILDFVSTFGLLDLRALDHPRLERQWYGVAFERTTPLRALRHYPGFGDESRHSAVDRTLRDPLFRDAEAAREAAPTWLITETIEEFRWGARALRDLRAAWECLNSGQDPLKVEWANPRMLRAGDDSRHAEWTISEFLERTLRDALEGFSPRMWLVEEESERPSIRAMRSPAPKDVTLFEVLALELFRHICEQATYKRCANPSCGHTFVRQDGGAVHRQSRTSGVLYCSRRCANTVAQRKHRERRRQMRP